MKFDSADIIIVGGGIIGCALLHELSKQKIGKIILIERGQLASGTTGESPGFIRKFHTDPYLAKLSETSFNYYQNFEKNVGLSCDFTPVKFHYHLPHSATSENQGYITQLENNHSIIVRQRADKTIIHEPDAGFINTTLACNAWAQAASQHDAYIYENTLVEEILTENSRITGVLTSQGVMSSPCVIITAGAWSQKLLINHKINLPFIAKSFQYHIYDDISDSLDYAFIDYVNEYYAFPLNPGRILAGFLNKDKNVSQHIFSHQPDTSITKSLHVLLKNQFPDIRQTHLLSTHLSYDAFSPSNHPLIHKIPELPGLVIFSALSGGGIKIAPSLAKKINIDQNYIHNQHPRKKGHISSCTIFL